ncbi:hypothetical protein MOV58_10690 [Staphylococcus hominis]|uniref:hypothetical protein n=1 Tax=Staphylococcus hominis TaxID=1290 RepID=UPI0010E13E24|nr:hypothetical protein [Staphylococcus hominis]TBW91743.1 hypothetical protein EQ808_00265 [Staphylococcus hominis]UNQ67826.1 hypothetical protein MOV58_10690 [Staphylococcus hominis]
METNLSFDLTSDLLTKDIRFHRDARKDEETSRKLFELGELLDDVFFDLKFVKNETLKEPNNLSGTRIRNQINNLLKEVKSSVHDIEVLEEEQ